MRVILQLSVYAFVTVVALAGVPDPNVCVPLPYLPGTINGNSNGAPCSPWYMYKSVNTTGCISTKDQQGPWCATTQDYDKDKKWGNCAGTTGGNGNGAPCVFPFKFQDDMINQCIFSGPPQPGAWCSTTADFDKDQKWGLCPDVGQNLPTLPDKFQAKINWQNTLTKSSLYLEEYYDKVNDFASMTTMGLSATGKKTTTITSFKTKEVFKVYEDGEMCVVSPLDPTNDVAFPFKVLNGSDFIMSAGDSLKFGKDYQEVYLGKDTVNGVAVNHWTACVFRPEMGDATLNIEYYWSDPDSWSTASGMSTVPVQAVITGKRTDAFGQPATVSQIYDFAFFSDELPDGASEKVFQTPRGYVCDGRKNEKKLPKVPDRFSFRSEQISESAGTVQNIDEWYDFNAKLFRMDFIPQGQLIYQGFGNRPLSTVHDFYTGTAYVMDRYYGNCTVMPIPDGGVDTVNNGAANYTQIRDPMQFFDFSGETYYYEGTGSARHIGADIYSSRRTDWDGIMSIWEWYFSKDGWTLEDGLRPEYNEPIRLVVRIPATMPGGQDDVSVLNIFNFDDSPMDYSAFDVSLCYRDLPQRTFRFVIVGDKSYVEGNWFAFKYLVLNAIEDFTGLRPIRTQDVSVEIDPNSHLIFFTFTMLDVSPLTGIPGAEFVPQTPNEVPLNVAASKLIATINSNNMSILMTKDDFSTTTMLQAMPGEIYESVKFDNGTVVFIKAGSSTPVTPPSTNSPHSGPSKYILSQ
ncbi:uncharacterized protein LOC106167415 [Lingula anatina]|uniref:Uncharacterized protein LOC106167415 n=1 Tax=Lingula anatina TaxID=7574 RepID=A0A1S3ITY5_LINAN|nr:uncharacterized protein LOC106167415 [Lingula anatina]|eukprot:XP_013401662.1 uncharacterized protein LOC106167415 [Lingula anatina]